MEQLQKETERHKNAVIILTCHQINNQVVITVLKYQRTMEFQRGDIYSLLSKRIQEKQNRALLHL